MAVRGKERRHVFIVGCRRSGTTWTMLLLAQHPEVVALQQIDFFRRLKRFSSWFDSDERYGMCVLGKNLTQGLHGSDTKSGLDRVPLASVLPRELYLRHARELANDVYDHFADCQDNTRVLVEQTPEYVQVWEDVLEIFPDATFLHVVRDPRSVFCSHRSAAKSWADPTRFSHDPLSVAQEWCDDVRRARAIASKTDRYLEVHYEALRKDSVEGLGEIFGFLGLDADRDLCAQAVEACSLEKMRGSSTAPAGFFRTGRTEGWRDEMSSAELHAVEYVAGDLMRELGYETVHAGVIPPPLRLRVRKLKRGAGNTLRRWAWGSEGPLRRGASRLLKLFPGLRRTLLNSIKKPV